ncbi:hypothetical protein GCM10020295_79450 [Streptomyces cinereospinus]
MTDAHRAAQPHRGSGEGQAETGSADGAPPVAGQPDASTPLTGLPVVSIAPPPAAGRNTPPYGAVRGIEDLVHVGQLRQRQAIPVPATSPP